MRRNGLAIWQQPVDRDSGASDCLTFYSKFELGFSLLTEMARAVFKTEPSQPSSNWPSHYPPSEQCERPGVRQADADRNAFRSFGPKAYAVTSRLTAPRSCLPIPPRRFSAFGWGRNIRGAQFISRNNPFAASSLVAQCERVIGSSPLVETRQTTSSNKASAIFFLRSTLRTL